VHRQSDEARPQSYRFCLQKVGLASGNLNRFRKKISKSGFHRLLCLHSQILPLLLLFLIFRDDVAHEWELNIGLDPITTVRTANSRRDDVIDRRRPRHEAVRVVRRRSVQQEMTLGHTAAHGHRRARSRSRLAVARGNGLRPTRTSPLFTHPKDRPNSSPCDLTPSLRNLPQKPSGRTGRSLRVSKLAPSATVPAPYTRSCGTFLGHQY
jgi:hypothetical protein